MTSIQYSRSNMVAQVGGDFELANAIQRAGDARNFRDVLVSATSGEVVADKTHELVGGLYLTGEYEGDFNEGELSTRLSRLDIDDPRMASFYDKWLEGTLLSSPLEEAIDAEFLEEGLTREALRSLLVQQHIGGRGLFLGGIEVRTTPANPLLDIYTVAVVPFGFRMVQRTLNEAALNRMRVYGHEGPATGREVLAGIETPMDAAFILTVSALYHELIRKNASKN